MAFAKEIIEALHGSPSTLYRSPSVPNVEHIVAAAILKRETGDVYLGDSHRGAMDLVDPDAELGSSEYRSGFWSSSGRFVDRTEAMRIARNQRQVEQLPTGPRMGSALDSAEMVPFEESESTISEGTLVGGPEAVRGAGIDDDWTAFSADSGTLGVPRAEMPQIDGDDRGELVDFLRTRGVASSEGSAPPGAFRPTQAEYSPPKVEKARRRGGEDRPIIVSSDDRIVDGHHQWMAALSDSPAAPIKVVRLHAPVAELLPVIAEFPKVQNSGGAGTPVKESICESPSTVYHSTTKDFDRFSVGLTSKNACPFGTWDVRRHAIFFTDDPAFAEEFVTDPESDKVLPGARTIPAVLDLR